MFLFSFHAHPSKYDNYYIQASGGAGGGQRQLRSQNYWLEPKRLRTKRDDILHTHTPSARTHSGSKMVPPGHLRNARPGLVAAPSPSTPRTTCSGQVALAVTPTLKHYYYYARSEEDVDLVLRVRGPAAAAPREPANPPAEASGACHQQGSTGNTGTPLARGVQEGNVLVLRVRPWPQQRRESEPCGTLLQRE